MRITTIRARTGLQRQCKSARRAAKHNPSQGIGFFSIQSAPFVHLARPQTPLGEKMLVDQSDSGELQWNVTLGMLAGYQMWR